MPPLPSTLPQETTDLISSTRRHQTDLLEFQIPRLRSCTGPLSTQQNLWAEIREDIEAYARQVEVSLFCLFAFVFKVGFSLMIVIPWGKALDISVCDLRGEKNRRELDGVVSELKEALGRCVNWQVDVERDIENFWLELGYDKMLVLRSSLRNER